MKGCIKGNKACWTSDCVSLIMAHELVEFVDKIRSANSRVRICIWRKAQRDRLMDEQDASLG